MTDRERALYFLGGLVAVFVLAYFLGSVLGPALGLGDESPAMDHSMPPSAGGNR